MSRIELPPGRKVTMKMPAFPDVAKFKPIPDILVDRSILLKAFLDVVDGMTAKELEHINGLDFLRNEEIVAIGAQAMKEYQQARK